MDRTDPNPTSNATDGNATDGNATDGAATLLRPSDLPAPPQVAVQILDACTDPDVDGRRLSTIVSADPSLCAELLRITNSAFFRRANPITSISTAVNMLGHQALRNLVLCLAVREALKSERLYDLDLRPFWHLALWRATAARAIGDLAGLDRDESFTIGLLQDIGLLALIRIHPESVGYWQTLIDASPEERYRLERELFGETHDDAGGQLATHWGFPQELVEVIAGHHHEDAQASNPQCRVAHTADWIAALYRVPNRGTLMREVVTLLESQWGVNHADSRDLILDVGIIAAKGAAALGLNLDEDLAREELTRSANLLLAEANLDSVEMNLRLEQALSERDELAAALQLELDKAKVVQRSLMPSAPRAIENGFISGVNLPARTLSGDFYDHLALKDGRVLFNLADVSGKGMDAALMMAKVSSLFHCLAKYTTNLRRLLQTVNRELLETSVRGMFVTIVVGIYDPKSKQVEVVNAGHPGPILIGPNKRSQTLDAKDPPLGILPYRDYTIEEHSLRERSLYLFSDGLLEARTSAGVELGYQGIEKLLRAAEKLPRTTRLARLSARLTRDGMQINDDVSILLVAP